MDPATLSRKGMLQSLAVATVSVSTPSAVVSALKSAANAPITLNVSAITESVGDQMRTLTTGYHKLHHNVSFVLNLTENRQYQLQFRTLMSSSDHPDIAWIQMGESFIPPLARDGYLLALDDLYKKFGWDKALPKATLDWYRLSDGHYYGVNLSVLFGVPLYINKAIFRKAGLDRPPRGYYASLQEFYAACDKITKAGYTPLALGDKEQWPLNHTWSTLMQRLCTPQQYNALLNNWRPNAPAAWTSVKYTDPAPVHAFQLIADWVKRGIFMPGFLGVSYDDGRAYFANGKAAMWQSLSGAYSKAELLGELPSTFELDYIWLPQLRPDVSPALLWFPGQALTLAKSTAARQQAAGDFLGYVISKPVQEAMTISSPGFLPSRVDVPASAFSHIGPLVARMYTDAKALGTSSFYDVRVPLDLYTLMYRLVQEVADGSTTAMGAAQQMQQKTEMLRAQGQ